MKVFREIDNKKNIDMFSIEYEQYIFDTSTANFFLTHYPACNFFIHSFTLSWKRIYLNFEFVDFIA